MHFTNSKLNCLGLIADEESTSSLGYLTLQTWNMLITMMILSKLVHMSMEIIY